MTDLEQIWSDYHRTFVEQPVVQGHIFEEAAFRWDQAFKGSVSRRFIVSPSQLGFASPWDPGGDVESEMDIGESLAVIPFAKIVSFLLDLDAHDAAMQAIKTFPTPLAKDLDERGIVYSFAHSSLHHLGATFNDEVDHLEGRDAGATATPEGPEVYFQKVVFHAFQTKYLTVRLRLKTHAATVPASTR